MKSFSNPAPFFKLPFWFVQMLHELILLLQSRKQWLINVSQEKLLVSVGAELFECRDGLVCRTVSLKLYLYKLWILNTHLSFTTFGSIGLHLASQWIMTICFFLKLIFQPTTQHLLYLSAEEQVALVHLKKKKQQFWSVLLWVVAGGVRVCVCGILLERGCLGLLYTLLHSTGSHVSSKVNHYWVAALREVVPSMRLPKKERQFHSR